MGRIFLEKLDIVHQRTPCEDAVEQVMTELGVVRHASGQRSFESIYVIQTLAGESAECEQILIKLGCRAGVGVGAGIASKNPVKHRALLPMWQRRCYAWLENTIAIHDTLCFRVEHRPVQRM